MYEYLVLHAKNPSIQEQFYGTFIHHLLFFSFISFILLGKKKPNETIILWQSQGKKNAIG